MITHASPLVRSGLEVLHREPLLTVSDRFAYTSLPTDTGLPSGLGTFSAPSLEPFPGTGSAPIDLTRTALPPVAMTSSASSPSSAITSVSMTGPTSGDGPMNGDSSNSGFLGHDTCLLALFIGALGAMGIIM